MLPKRNSILPYPQKYKDISHMTLSGRREEFCNILVDLACLVEIYCFFVLRVRGVKFLYFKVDVICE